MYNEADNVAALLERLAAVRERAGLDLVALAVDDGSRDATAQRLADARPRYPFLRIVRPPTQSRHGRGAAHRHRRRRSPSAIPASTRWRSWTPT